MQRFSESLMEELGKSIDDPSFSLFCDKFDISKRPAFPAEDAYSAYLSDKERGFSLVFSRQSHIKNPLHHNKSRNVLVLVGCHFYTAGHEGFCRYCGDLPFDLSLDDNLAKVWGKLGRPVWQYVKDNIVRRERWEFSNFQINVGYSKTSGSLRILYLGIREFFSASPKADQ